MRFWVFVAVLVIVAVGGSSWAAIHILIGLNDITLSFHGKLAMGLGIAVSLLIGIGLMALVFYSARHGHDDIQNL